MKPASASLRPAGKWREPAGALHGPDTTGADRPGQCLPSIGHPLAIHWPAIIGPFDPGPASPQHRSKPPRLTDPPVALSTEPMVPGL
jgi:hypothetical protein